MVSRKLSVVTQGERIVRTAYIYEGIEYRVFNRKYAVSRSGEVLRKTRGELAPFAPRLRPDGYLEAGKNGPLPTLVAICLLERTHGAKNVHHPDSTENNKQTPNLPRPTHKQQ